MKIKPGVSDVLWMAAGAAILLVIVLVVLRFRADQGPAEQLASKARRSDLVEGMRSALASASEAEKSAVLALTDPDAQRAADEARAATTEVERQRRELEDLLNTGGHSSEKALLLEFSKHFTEFQKIDHDLLALAIKNTNLEATRLAFGPAAEAAKELDGALARIVTKSAASANGTPALLLAHAAETAALRIQVLLPPHIAEESDLRMDTMEALMSKEDQELRKSLDGLSALDGFRTDPDLAAARDSYKRFSELRAQILKLSRENTHVRSLALSLNEKRKVMFKCQDALDALQKAILEEPIAGVDYGAPSNPRQIRTEPRAVH